VNRVAKGSLRNVCYNNQDNLFAIKKQMREMVKHKGENMKYDKVIEGTFIDRPNRFIANVLIDGKEETVHVRNTGRCRELLVPGAKIILEDCSINKNRKTRYSLIAVWKGDMLVNMDSQIPNKVVLQAIKEKKIYGFEDLTFLKQEAVYGKSRFDIYFETANDKGFIEVKGVTLEDGGVCMFPDAPTLRGTKHILEMIDAVSEGYIGIVFFLIQMKGPKLFRLNWGMDKAFSEAVALANKKGVKILAYDSRVTRDSILLDKQIKTDLREA
jgi:sugar fermentation stimulation protein A